MVVCAAYNEAAQLALFVELEPLNRFEHLAQIVRAYISEANSSFSRRITNFVAELTWRHLQTEGLLKLTSGSGQRVYQSKETGDLMQQVLQAFAHYITGHGFAHGGASTCATRGSAEMAMIRTALEEIKASGRTNRISGREIRLALVGARDFFSL